MIISPVQPQLSTWSHCQWHEQAGRRKEERDVHADRRSATEADSQPKLPISRRTREVATNARMGLVQGTGAEGQRGITQQLMSND